MGASRARQASMVIAALKLLAAVLFVDFVSGFVHWMEDAYGNEELPVIGKLVTLKNNLHHQNPAYFAGFGWWHNSWLLYLVSAAVGLVVWALGWFTWPVAVVLVLGAHANQVHQWAHRSRRVNGPVITRLKREWSEISQQEVELLFRRLSHLSDTDRDAIERSLERIVNKLLHPPLETLKDEAKDGPPEGLLNAMKRLFQLRD